MDTLEKDLAAMLADGAPPARDTAFTIGVMARIEQHRFYRELIFNAMIAAAAAAVLWSLSPSLMPLLLSVTGDLVAVLALVGGGILAMQWSLREMDA